MTNLGRNDPCHCGSGLKYKYCHLNLDIAKVTDKLSIEYDAYINKWKTNSACFESQGCYAWMAKTATNDSPRLLLDIGCGDGLGLKAILQGTPNPDLRIIAIDENISCLREAERTLKKAGFTVELLNRTTISTAAYGTYGYTFHPITPTTYSQVTLLQSDLLSDPLLALYLGSLGKIDAITLWLVGTHNERVNCEDIKHLSIRGSGEYRLRVQNKAYELADSILKKGGILQIVDRGEVPTTDLLKQDFLNSYRDQASVTSMKVLALDFMIYEEPQAQKKIAMQKTLGTSGRIPDLTRTAMLSVLSRR